MEQYLGPDITENPTPRAPGFLRLMLTLVEIGNPLMTYVSLKKYQPTSEERAAGMMSSRYSSGRVGRLNDLLARVTFQEEVDFVGFLRAGRIEDQN